MHCVLLVVCRVLLRLWFNSPYHKEQWYIGRAVKRVDTMLCNFRPPDEIQRTPRPIETTVKYWKGEKIKTYICAIPYGLICVCVLYTAHELRVWLLHYSPVVLKGVLEEDYYQHHLLLVEGVFLLLKDAVSDADMHQSARLLQHYCFLTPALYGTYICFEHGACMMHMLQFTLIFCNIYQTEAILLC